MGINASQITTGEAYKILKEAWKMQTLTREHEVIMLHGQPGVGKTKIVHQLAKELNGKLYDFRATNIDTSNIRGLPYYDHEAKKTRWYRPEDLPDEDESTPVIMFFDELTAAPPHLTPSIYGILQEQQVGQHKIGKNVLIVAAGNTVDDGAIAYEMNTALSDRMTHFIVIPDAESFITNYAIPNNLHPAVIAFLKVRPDLISNGQECLKQQHMIATTQRSWEKVSNYMFNIKDKTIRNKYIAGRLGSHVAQDFILVADEVEVTVNVMKIIKAKPKTRLGMYPLKLYGLQTLIFSIIGMLNNDIDFTKNHIRDCFDIFFELGNLSEHFPNAQELPPTKELRTMAIEHLLGAAINHNMVDCLNELPSFHAYNKDRQENGLF